jgi:hypothetical protein
MSAGSKGLDCRMFAWPWEIENDRDKGGVRAESILLRFAAVVCQLLCSRTITAQNADTDEKEGLAILEVGAEESWNINGGAATFGPNLAVEVTPIEKWLELEAGMTPFFTHNGTGWDTDLLFKKPWTFSRKVEFMVGVGPEWIHLRQNGATTNSFAVEIAGDFMFWPAKKHKFGWYLEPAWERSFGAKTFGAGHEQSLGMSGSLLISIP